MNAVAIVTAAVLSLLSLTDAHSFAMGPTQEATCRHIIDSKIATEVPCLVQDGGDDNVEIEIYWYSDDDSLAFVTKNGVTRLNGEGEILIREEGCWSSVDRPNAICAFIK